MRMRLLHYWLIGSKIPMHPLNDKLKIVWRLFPVKVCNGKSKRGFVVRRDGVFCGVKYHDLKWYRRFVRLHKVVLSKDMKAPRLMRFIKR